MRSITTFSLLTIVVLSVAMPSLGEEPKEPQPVKIGWKDGKTTLSTEQFAISLSNRLQVRLTAEDPDGGDSKASFRIRRAKTKLEGWAYTRNLTWELQLNWADTANQLEDVNINYATSKALQVKVGQFKVPFGRQELTSSMNQQFVDRSIVSGEFAKGRDVGVQLWGSVLEERIDWRVGAFNGNGRGVSTNDNDAFQYDARITFQPFGDVKYSESDFESRAKPLFAIAAQYEHNDRAGATTGNDVSREVAGADVVFKYRGFSGFAEYFSRANDPELGASSTSTGWNAQAGYFVVRDRFEIAARYATLDPSDLFAGNARTETGVAFNWFVRKHNLKLQTDVRSIDDEATGRTNREARVQLQMIF